MWIGHVYTTQQIADTLSIGRSTVNKYARSLEDQGYAFTKGENGRRAFTEHDLIMFRALLELMDRGVKYDLAISTIVSRYAMNPDTKSSVVSSQNVSMESKLNDLTVAVQMLSERVESIIDDRVKSEVSLATERLNTQIPALSDQLRDSQEKAEVVAHETGEKLDTLLSRLDKYERLPWWKFWKK